MITFGLYLVLSLVVYGILAFVGLLAGIGMVGASSRGKGTRLICAVMAVAFGIFCATSGAAALGGTAAAAFIVFFAVMLRR